MEPLEDRTLLSVMPAPAVSGQTSVAAGVSPQVVISPIDPRVIVEVYTTGASVAGRYTTNTGTTWSNLAFPASGFPEASSPSVSFDLAQNVYVTAAMHDAGSVTGAILLYKFNPAFALVDLDPVAAGVNPSVIYRWANDDPAYNPYVAIDTNLPSFTDPVTGGVQTDSLANSLNGRPKAIYVAWNTDFTGSSSRIMAAASGDGGTIFTSPQFACGGGG